MPVTFMVFRGRRGDLSRCFGMTGSACPLYASVSIGAGFIWPSAAEGWLRSRRGNRLLAGGDRLAKPATHVATAERRIALKKLSGVQKQAPQIADL